MTSLPVRSVGHRRLVRADAHDRCYAVSGAGQVACSSGRPPSRQQRGVRGCGPGAQARTCVWPTIPVVEPAADVVGESTGASRDRRDRHNGILLRHARTIRVTSRNSEPWDRSSAPGELRHGPPSVRTRVSEVDRTRRRGVLAVYAIAHPWMSDAQARVVQNRCYPGRHPPVQPRR